jgi:hypothetical protein
MRVRGGLLPALILGLTLLAGAIPPAEGRAARQLSSGVLSARSGDDLPQEVESPAQLDEKIYLPIVMKRCGPGESDNIDDAPTICSGHTLSGQVSEFADEDDVYKILAEAGQQLTISMNGSGGDADLYLYPPGTTDVDTDPWFTRSINPDNNEFIQATLPVGGYWYIDVFSFDGTTNYNVTVTLSGPGAAATTTFNLTGASQVRDRQQGR